MAESEETKAEVPKISAGLAFTGLIALRNNETLIRMHRAHFSIALNVAGLATVLVRLSLLLSMKLGLASPWELGVYCAGGILAVVANHLWSNVTVRSNDFLGYYNGRIRQHVKNCGIEGDLEIYMEEFERLVRRGVRFKRGWTAFVWLVMVLWGVISITSLVLMALTIGAR